MCVLLPTQWDTLSTTYTIPNHTFCDGFPYSPKTDFGTARNILKIQNFENEPPSAIHLLSTQQNKKKKDKTEATAAADGVFLRKSFKK